jgi:hypothetical protein
MMLVMKHRIRNLAFRQIQSVHLHQKRWDVNETIFGHTSLMKAMQRQEDIERLVADIVQQYSVMLKFQ